MKGRSIVGAAALLVAGTSFSYDTLVWTGKYNNYFDTTTANWTNQLTGAEAVFEAAEAVDRKTNPIVFRVPEETDVTVAINQTNNQGIMNPASILFDVDGTMTFTNNHGDYFLSWGNGPWTKTGAGKVDCNTTKSRMFIHPTQLTVEEGEFWCTGNYMMQYWFPNNCPITVKSGATLHLRGTNLEGGDKTKRSLSKITVEAGGKFCIDTYKNDGVTLQNGHNVLPPMEFNRYDGFDCSYCKAYAYKQTSGADFLSLCRFSLSGKVTLNGSGTPYEWLESSVAVDSRYSGVNLWCDKLTEFEVADVTGDANVDFNLNFILCNFCTSSTSDGCVPAGFTKSGPGTMRLSNTDNQFTGDIDVKGGTLQVGQDTYDDRGYHMKTHLGWMDRNADRKITTYSGGTLEILGGITFGNADSPYYAPYSSITNDHILGEFVFDGGALKIADGKWNAFPSLTFKNGGTVNTGCNSGGNEGNGRIRFLGTFSVLKGTVNTPFVWPLDGETYKTRSGYRQYAGQGITLNGYPENTFRIEDLTDDDGVDATFEVPFFISNAFFRDWKSGNHTLDDWSFGFTKTGDGTLRYAAPDVFAGGSSEKRPACCTYNGDTKVNEGTLQMDGDISRSDTVRVAAGAYLAGTGTVNNVALAAGAGWKASADQANPLTVKGDLAVGANQTISISLPVGGAREDIRAKVLKDEGTTTGLENLLNATVKVNGAVVTDVRPTLRNGVVVVRYVKGLAIILK